MTNIALKHNTISHVFLPMYKEIELLKGFKTGLENQGTYNS